MTSFTSITASLMILLDKTLDIFVTVEMTNAQAACSIGVVNGTLTNCGLSFVDALVDFTFTVTEFTSGMLLGLSVS